MASEDQVEIVVIGAGIAGIATAYYLCTRHERASVLLIDCRQPMAYTSAQSGDNYRNWWPHPTMTRFMNDSIDLLEEIAEESANIINMTRRGYLLATRQSDIDDLIARLHAGYESDDRSTVRIHDASTSYEPPDSDDWTRAPEGVDVLTDAALIRQCYPSMGEGVRHLVHIRRAGDISGQQLGQYMLERIREVGGRIVRGEVKRVRPGFAIDIQTGVEMRTIRADILINATGPFAVKVAEMLDQELPIDNVFQQKLAFEDSLAAVPRDLPFTIDLDEQMLPWSPEERTMFAEDTDLGWLTGPIRGGVHCRPEGGDSRLWVKLGWAYNVTTSEPQTDLANEPLRDPHFPEIVIRGASSLNPGLAAYIENPPARRSHYGGYYSMTAENWPLIGPMGTDGAFMVAALSGFGSMAACAAGSLCAAWATDAELPDYAQALSLARYDDGEFMSRLQSAADKGLL